MGYRVIIFRNNVLCLLIIKSDQVIKWEINEPWPKSSNWKFSRLTIFSDIWGAIII